MFVNICATQKEHINGTDRIKRKHAVVYAHIYGTDIVSKYMHFSNLRPAKCKQQQKDDDDDDDDNMVKNFTLKV